MTTYNKYKKICLFFMGVEGKQIGKYIAVLDFLMYSIRMGELYSNEFGWTTSQTTAKL